MSTAKVGRCASPFAIVIAVIEFRIMTSNQTIRQVKAKVERALTRMILKIVTTSVTARWSPTVVLSRGKFWILSGCKNQDALSFRAAQKSGQRKIRGETQVIVMKSRKTIIKWRCLHRKSTRVLVRSKRWTKEVESLLNLHPGQTVVVMPNEKNLLLVPKQPQSYYRRSFSFPCSIRGSSS